MSFETKLSECRVWLQALKRTIAKFILCLIFVYILVGLSVWFELPAPITFFSLLCTLLVPFALIVMLLTENILYEKLYNTVWGKAVIGVGITFYGALAYIWAAGEVNQVFAEASGNFPWAVTALAVVYFFKNVVLVFALVLLAGMIFYAPLWLLMMIINEEQLAKVFFRKLGGGILLLLGVSMLMGTANAVTLQARKLAIHVALYADFSSNYHCNGAVFNGVSQVLFLPSGSVLIAKTVSNEQRQVEWRFPRGKCDA
ncbi:hypothetical protein C7A11_18330 [Pseudomonas simiae]|uniref:hypothetical protein n=1 Tax=Pseudomonas simiae TaxID=321846 RepID=UPI000D02B7A5|nr:hypothetical protein [Pseudomonas simiae]PRW87176.1 hypothetical protein C7A11_18330 [Pseudomonas simiae]